MRRGTLQAKVATPIDGLFCRLQTPFLKALRKKGVVVKLNHSVKLAQNKIEIINKKTNYIKNISKEKIYFGHSPLGALQSCNTKKTLEIFKNERSIMLAILKCFPARSMSKFTEMLCCYDKFSNIARISQIQANDRSEADHFLLELYTSPQKSPRAIRQQILEFCDFAKKKFGYKQAVLIKVTLGRKAFFPSAHSLQQTLRQIKKWARKFPSVNVPDFIGPINMAKAWDFSEAASKNQGRP